MVQTFENMPFLGGRTDPHEEISLWPLVDNPIAPGDQQLDGNCDRGCVGDDSRGGIMKPQKHVHRNCPSDQGIDLMRGNSRCIVCQKSRLYITIDEKIAARC